MKKDPEIKFKKERNPLIPPEDTLPLKRNHNLIIKELKHLERVKKEIKKLQKELLERPDNFGVLKYRLEWAIRGVDPHYAICVKHNKELFINCNWEIFCPNCADEADSGGFEDENNWYDLNDKPVICLIYHGDKSERFY